MAQVQTDENLTMSSRSVACNVKSKIVRRCTYWCLLTWFSTNSPHSSLVSGPKYLVISLVNCGRVFYMVDMEPLTQDASQFESNPILLQTVFWF